jgi:hypothetical protein
MRAAGILITLALGCGRVGFMEVCSGCGNDGGSGSGITRGHVTNPGTQNSATQSLMIDGTAGELAVLITHNQFSANEATVTDSNGSTWSTIAAEQTMCGGNLTTRIFYTMLAASGSDSITLSIAPSVVDLGMVAVQYAGVDSADPVDSSSGQVAASTTQLASAGQLTLTGDDLIVAALADAAADGTLTPGSGFAYVANDDVVSLVVEDEPASAGMYSPTASLPAGKPDACWIGTALALRAK